MSPIHLDGETGARVQRLSRMVVARFGRAFRPAGPVTSMLLFVTLCAVVGAPSAAHGQTVADLLKRLGASNAGSSSRMGRESTPGVRGLDGRGREGRTAAAAARDVELRWKLETGTELVYRLVAEIEMEYEGLPGVDTVTPTLEVTTRWNVLDVDGAGDATVLVTVERLQMRVDTPTRTISLDSEDESPDQMGDVAERQYSMILDPHGRIVSTYGVDELGESWHRTADPYMQALVGPLASQWGQYGLILPEGAVGVGFAWEVPSESPFVPPGSTVINSHDIEAIEGDVVVIGTAATWPSPPTFVEPDVSMRIGEMVRVTTSRFDIGKGLLVASDGTTTNEATMTLDDGERVVETDTVMTVTVELLTGPTDEVGPEFRSPDEIRAGESRFFDGMEFVWVPPGQFSMGSASSEADDERPVTRVRISRGFWLGKYEVIQAQWESVMGSNPSRFSDCGGNCPVEMVSWEDVQGFIGRLNARAGREVYRLPTEAEWEYAAQAGTTGDRYGSLDGIAWWDGNSGNRTHPVGGKSANGWGLHDMLGNVGEWVQDWYGAYPGGTVTDPRGPGSGSYRVRRGGNWYSYARDARASSRFINVPGHRYNSLGFRLLRTTR